jgi:hypothetical protein
MIPFDENSEIRKMKTNLANKFNNLKIVDKKLRYLVGLSSKIIAHKNAKIYK